MQGFNAMAEAKMRQWETEKREGTSKPTAQGQLFTINTGDSLEKQLYADIKRLIEQSHQEPPEKRDQTLREVEKIQVQLLTRLEISGCRHLTRILAEEIQKMKSDTGQ